MGADLEVPVLIARKRDGEELAPEELRAFVAAYLVDDVAEEQMAAFLMAAVLRGLSASEASALTDAYVASGATVDLGGLPGPTVDKHSTGGVGDTTTLVVGPMLAAAGCQVAKLSGRGLGHTGGTLDKLEAIPGFRVDLSPNELTAQVADIGIAVAAATADLVPADRRIYALRDVTATVPSPGLIAASVMSKKLAGGADHILLDVKVGEGAFVADVDGGHELAELCVRIGDAAGRRTAALVTDMAQPLGDGVGNALEVGVAIETLRGERAGPLRELSIALTAAALTQTGLEEPREAGAAATALLTSGAALGKFQEMVAAQGGDPSVADRPWQILPTAPVVRDWSPGAGTVGSFACRRLGELAGRLGAGRQRPGAAVDPAVGLEVLVRVGDQLVPGEPAVRIHARHEEDAAAVVAELPQVVRFTHGPVRTVPLVQARIGLPDELAHTRRASAPG